MIAQSESRLAYRVADVAAMLDVPIRTAYLLVERKDLPAIRVGRAIRIPAEALRAWLTERQAAGA
jgi:excisionase family DNA binding protein